jgi:hypothetical protein
LSFSPVSQITLHLISFMSARLSEAFESVIANISGIYKTVSNPGGRTFQDACEMGRLSLVCYANIDDKAEIVPAEDALLEAYLPPTNVEMPGKLRNKMAFLTGT